ncbi:MAG: phosphonate ABC transporter substrate-binding protein [Desulfotalea sp.]
MRNLLVAVLVLCAITTVATSSFAKEEWPEKIKMGFIPTEGASGSLERFRPLTDFLSSVLKIKVEPYSASDYAGIITAMSHKHIDFAYLGPKSYIEAVEKANAEALVIELDSDGKAGYTGLIIVNSASDINSLEEIKGRSFCFTDPNSTSGYLVPNVLFARDLKIKPENYFSNVSFSGAHGNSINAVKNNKIEVAATNDIDLNRMIQKGQVAADDFRILWRSELIPGAPMAARKDLPTSLKAAFTGAMLMFNEMPGGKEKLQNGGYRYTNDSTYDVIRYMKRLKNELTASN